MDQDQNPDLASKKFKVVPADDANYDNCIVINDGARFESPEEIIPFAIENGAFLDNSHDEAGDDEYLIQFPGGKQESLTSDEILGILRELQSGY